ERYNWLERRHVWIILLQHGREQQAYLHLRKRHPNTDTRPSTKGKVSPLGKFLLLRRVPTLRTKSLRISPNFWHLMRHPLMEEDNRSSRKAISIEFNRLYGAATNAPGRRIDAPGFVHDPLQIGQLCQILHRRCSPLKNCAQFGKHLFMYCWMLRQ